MQGQAPPSWTGYASLENEPKVYTLMIDGKPYNLLDFVKRLTQGPFNFKSISVRHPDEWYVRIERDGPTETQWYLNKSYPASAYHLTHSFGTDQIDIPNENISDLWEIIKGDFPGIEQAVHNARTNRNLRVRAAEQFVTKRGGPEELGVEIASYIEGPRPRGWATPLNNIRKINTTLFNGGKRKQKRKHRSSKTKKNRKH